MAEDRASQARLESSSPEANKPSPVRLQSSSPQAESHPNAPIEADDVESEIEDGYETSSNPSTSIASSVRDFNFENKRRYHKFKEGQYLLPNDDVEQEREDMKHALVLHVCEGALHNAPLESPQKVLDIGTGTGIWAMDMGDEYPEAEITGLDLSPIQPGYVPPNVHFIIDDVEADWVHPDNSIDYIHIRNMAMAIKDWSKLFSQAYKALKPGGWIEMQDLVWDFACDDGSIGPEYSIRKAVKLIDEAFQKFGVDIHAGGKFGGWITDAGFVNLIHDKKKVPVGTWPKDPHMKAIGNYCRAVNYDALGSVTNVPFTKGLGWSTTEIEVFLIQVRKDLTNDKFHPYHWYHSFSGQKPQEKD